MRQVSGLVSIGMKVIAGKVLAVTAEINPLSLLQHGYTWHGNRYNGTLSVFTSASFANRLLKRNARLF